jgi:uncharacterized protein (DUF342 family)
MDMLNETKASIETEINQIRLAINGYLDKLKKELLTKLQEASHSAKGQIMELVATLAENEKEICVFIFCKLSWHSRISFSFSAKVATNSII